MVEREKCEVCRGEERDKKNLVEREISLPDMIVVIWGWRNKGREKKVKEKEKKRKLWLVHARSISGRFTICVISLISCGK